MANVQIPNLPAVIALTGEELFEGVQAGSSVKISLGQMISAARTGIPTTVPLPVSAGGTGTTTSTGTGSVVLSDSPTLVTPIITLGTFGLGTAGAPSITFTGDTNTGIYSPGADTLSISTAGLQRFVVSATGNASLLGVSTEDRAIEIGVNRSGDGNSFLDLVGDATYTDYGARFIRSAGANAISSILHRGLGALRFVTEEAAPMVFNTTGLERMRVHPSGGVSIGNTADPGSTNLSVTGVGLFGLGAVGAPSYTFIGDTNTGMWSPGADTVAFSTNGAERMRINSAGFVGIGTTNPSVELDVLGDGLIARTQSTTSNNAYLRFDGTGTSFPFIGLLTGIGTFGNTDASPIRINTNSLERMRVHASGGVSIGNITDPGATNLSVTGVGSFGLGTALLPSVTFNGDLNTGMWSPGADTIAFSTNGAERYRIGSAGQLGIAGANFGAVGQTIISGGPSAATSWGQLSLTTGVTGTLPLANGGTGATSAPAAAAALYGYTTTATAAGTTVLTNTSSQYQLFTGTTTQTITLPVTSTLTTGWSFHIVNSSTGNLTINSSGGNLVATVIPGTTVMVTCILTSGTTAASWEFGFTDFNTLTGTGSVVMSDGPTITSGAFNGTVGATTPSTGAFTVGTFNLGAVGTPSITFAGDTNTGIWSPGADIIAFSTGGAERLRIDSAGSITQPNAVSGSGVIVGEQVFRLAADGVAFGPGNGDFFGATSAISLEASSVYEITIYAVFTKTTAGTATFTLTASSAPTRMVGTYQASPITGIAAGAVTSGFAGSQGATTAAFAATGSLTTAVNHAYQFRVQVQTNAAANFRLQLGQSAGTATPLAGSYYTVKKISATTGTFVA